MGRPQTRKEQQIEHLFGWFYHFLIGDSQVATGHNFHTHGINKIGHLDLQIVFPMPEKKALAIVKTIYDQIQDGQQFGDGDETLILHEDGSKYPVRFVKVRESDRQVLRVIVPTPDGKLEPKDVAEHEPDYALQWTVGAV